MSTGRVTTSWQINSCFGCLEPGQIRQLLIRQLIGLADLGNQGLRCRLRQVLVVQHHQHQLGSAAVEASSNGLGGEALANQVDNLPLAWTGGAWSLPRSVLSRVASRAAGRPRSHFAGFRRWRFYPPPSSPQAVQHLAEQLREHDLVLHDQAGKDHQVQPVSQLA